MSNDEPRFEAARPDHVELHLEQLAMLREIARRTPPLDTAPEEPDRRFLDDLDRLIEHTGAMADDYHLLGRDVVTRMQQRYPALFAALDRELLWFFGGECLHYLSDEEIAAFQARDERGDPP